MSKGRGGLTLCRFCNFFVICLQSKPKFWTKSTYPKIYNLKSLKYILLSNSKKINVLPSNMLWVNCQGDPHVFHYNKIPSTIFIDTNCQLLIYKSTTYLPCQSTIHKFLGQQEFQKKSVDSTLNIRRNLHLVSKIDVKWRQKM